MIGRCVAHVFTVQAFQLPNDNLAEVMRHVQTDDLHIEELQQLAVAIDRDMPDERMDARAIARFQTGLIQFMESALGPNVNALLTVCACAIDMPGTEV